MGESIFLQPIKRWLSSRKSNKGADSALLGSSLTPEEQYAQLMGNAGNPPAQMVAGLSAPVATAMAPNISTGPSTVCGQCGQSISQDAKFCPYCSNQIAQVAAPAAVPIEPQAVQPIQPTTLEDIPKPVMQRISIGATGEGSPNDEPTVQVVESSLADEQPIQAVERVSPALPDLSDDDDDDDESTNVAMAGSLRGIFTNKTAINPDTVAFLERHGTVGTQELLDELISLHRALR
jgi:hypothetical protein